MKLDTALLFTCRRAYIETATLPLRNTTISIVPAYYLPDFASLGAGEFHHAERGDSCFAESLHEGLKITRIEYLMDGNRLHFNARLDEVAVRQLERCRRKT